MRDLGRSGARTIKSYFSSSLSFPWVSTTALCFGMIASTSFGQETRNEGSGDKTSQAPSPSLPQLLGPALIEKDWRLEKWKYADNEPSVCIASTESKASKAESPSNSMRARLEVLVPESELVLPQIRLRLLNLEKENLDTVLQEVFLKVDRKTLRPLRKKEVQAETSSISYGLSPLDLDTTLQFLRAQSSADIALTTAKNSPLIRLSLSGSSKILQKAAECRPSKTILAEAFDKWLKVDFQKALAAEGTVEELNDGSTKTLESLILQNRYESELSALKKDRERLTPLETQRRRAMEAALSVLQRAQSRLARTEKEKAETTALLSNSQTQLPLDQAQIPNLTATLKSAEEVFAPVRTKVIELESALAAAQDRESSASQQVSSLSSNLGSLHHRRVQLENEIQRISHDIFSMEREAEDVGRRISRLEWDLRQFDLQQRIRQILLSDGSYQNEKNESQNLKARLQNMNSELQQTVGALQALETVLRECQSAQPPRDCTALQNQVSERRNRRDQLQREVQEGQQRLQHLENILSQKESSAQSKAQFELNELRQNLDQHQRRFSELQSWTRFAYERRNQIQNFELPQTSQNIQLAESQLQAAQRDLEAASRQVRRKQEELSQFKISSNYDALRRNVREAQKALSSLQEKISIAEDNVKTLPGKLVSLNAQIKTETEQVNKAEVPYKKAQSDHDLTLAEIKKTEDLQTQTKELIEKTKETLITLRPRLQGISKFLFPLKTVSN